MLVKLSEEKKKLKQKVQGEIHVVVYVFFIVIPSNPIELSLELSYIFK